MYVELLPEKAWTSRPYRTVKVLRMFFALHEAMNLPDKYFIGESVANEPTWREFDDPDQWVILHFHRVSNNLAAASELMRSLAVARGVEIELDRINNAPFGGNLGSTTVVEAVTPAVSVPYASAGGDDVRLQLPSHDPINRCIRLVRDYSRSAIVAYERRVSPVSYDNVYPFVIMQHGSAIAAHGVPQSVQVCDKSWSGDQLIMLDHQNFPGFRSMDQIADGPQDEKIDYWLEELRVGSPFFRWRELYVSARREIENGDYMSSIILSQTAGEVLLDGVLCLLLWEGGTTPADARKLFDLRDLVPRVTTELAQRLGGEWSTAGSGAFAQWYEHCSKIRHRIVHAGYDPTWNEARQASSVTSLLITHSMDRLSDKRTTYPRSTLMTVARSGLVKRGLWSGKIVKFYDEVAQVEPNWKDSFADWRQEFSAS